MAAERQELHCHECGNYVQFDMDLSVDGDYVLKCPVCGHEHCRVVKNGEITDERWDSRNSAKMNPNTYYIVNNITVSAMSTFTQYDTNNPLNSQTNNTLGTFGSNVGFQGQFAGTTQYVGQGTNPTAQAMMYMSWMNTTTT
jgi:hypothetical protein